jgi:hypothetical protein
MGQNQLRQICLITQGAGIQNQVVGQQQDIDINDPAVPTLFFFTRPIACSMSKKPLQQYLRHK